MGTHNFEGTERRLKARKYPVVFGTGAPHYWGKNKPNEEPKDLAEAIYRLLGRKEGTVIKLPTGKYRYQCELGRMRSIQDLFNLVRTYYPNIKYKYLYDTVSILKENKSLDGVVKGQLLSSHFCCTTQREVHWLANIRATENDIRNRIGHRNILFKGGKK